MNQQLAEVLSLLRSRLASGASVSPASVSIPRELTAEIASEVAHQVKQEVLSKMESALKQLKKSASRRQKVESTKKLRLSALARGLRRAVTPGNPAGAEAEAPRVPLDDVPGLIDQMLRGKEAPQQEKPFR
ncbi:MAG: hypothetical protein JXA90_09885 [Planctomycetes bacterium]|nr:hypothetical protein [Planctomycetota bacterium]